MRGMLRIAASSRLRPLLFAVSSLRRNVELSNASVVASALRSCGVLHVARVYSKRFNHDVRNASVVAPLRCTWQKRLVAAAMRCYLGS